MEGTLVWACDIETGEDFGLIAIDRVQELGLDVFSKNVATGEVLCKMAEPLIRTSDHFIELELVNDDGVEVDFLEVTEEHPFWTRTGWAPIGELVPGTEVFSQSSGWLQVGSATWVQGDVQVFNFEVQDWQNYFVGDAQTWVHNTCGGALSRGAQLRAKYGGIPTAELHQRINLRAAVVSERAALRAGPRKLSGKARGPVLSGIMDQRTGQIFYGRNQLMIADLGAIHPALAARITSSTAAHSELVALNSALWARGSAASIDDFLLFNARFSPNKGLGIIRCPSCQLSTSGVTSLSYAP
ncbi:MAG: hypothetical protein GY822_00155 [Deltaproteobacteria bacterium]|nr:hypothetical protein [Deltaproteobacteria bacterium]